ATSSRYADISRVQPKVNAFGKKPSTTPRLPLKSSRRTVVPLVAAAENAGALAPTAGRSADAGEPNSSVMSDMSHPGCERERIRAHGTRFRGPGGGRAARSAPKGTDQLWTCTLIEVVVALPARSLA